MRATRHAVETPSERPSAAMRDSADNLLSQRVAARAAAFSLFEHGGAADSRVWQFLHRHRVRGSFALGAFCWLPLVFFVSAGRALTGHHALIAFARDFAVHVRALVALPILIAVDPLVDHHVRSATQRFLRCGLIKRSELTAFEATLDTIERARDAPLALALLVAISLVGSVVSATHGLALPSHAWSVVESAGTARRLTVAGWWYVGVQLPIFQFVMLNWVWRWLLWTYFLWRTSRLDLQLLPTHADRSAGLGFIGVATSSFFLATFGPSLVVSATWIDAMLNRHLPIDRLWGPIIAEIVLTTVIVMAPILFFNRRLRRVAHDGAANYAVIVQRYIRRFDRAWIDATPPTEGDSLRDLDAQNMADLINVYEVILHMRFIPIEKRVAQNLAAGVLVPILPIIVASASPKVLVSRIVEALL